MARIARVLVLLLIASLVLLPLGLLACSPKIPKPPQDRPPAAASPVDPAARRAWELRLIETDPEFARSIGLIPGNDPAPVPVKPPPADLGLEAGKRDLANTATWVGRLGYFAAVAGILGLVAGSFLGGVGRRSSFLVLGIAAGCLWLRYFVRVHGFFVSEAVSWGLIVGGGLGCLLGMLFLLRVAWARWNAGGLAAKRAENADDGRDAIALLPLPQRVKSQIHDAWDTARGVRAGSAADAARVLRRYALPMPRQSKS